MLIFHVTPQLYGCIKKELQGFFFFEQAAVHNFNVNPQGASISRYKWFYNGE